MVPARRRTLGEEDEMDIVSGLDEEKRAFVARDTSIDYHGYEASPASSRNGYTSQDPILSPKKPARRRVADNSIFYRVPNHTVRWLCLALFFSLVFFILALIHMSQQSAKRLAQEAAELKAQEPPPPPPWEAFPFLKRYYGGIRTLGSTSNRTPEYPNDNEHPQIDIESNTTRASAGAIPPSRIYHPYPDYQSTEYTAKWGKVEECFLNDEKKIPPPRIQGFEGAVKGFPEPIMGSYEALGLTDALCYDRFGRLGPYGFGYSKGKGGTGAGLDGDREGVEAVWNPVPQIDYREINWADAQDRCYRKNQHRFPPKPEFLIEKWREMGFSIWDNATLAKAQPFKATDQQLPRTAVIIRIWHSFEWTQEAIVYMRGLISELALLSGGEYHVHFLIHVKDDRHQIWASDELYAQTLRDALPEEFRGMGTLWSERQMLLIYDGLEETWARDLPVHGVYRSAHFPLQYFAHKHPEYDYFWNWEMDVRYTGHWYALFEKLRAFAREQPRKGLWERAERFYVPAKHGSWEDFKQMARVQSEMLPTQSNKWANAGPPGYKEPVAEPPVWGRKAPNDAPIFDDDPEPPTTPEKDHNQWGVGEEADLITLNPIFNPEHTGWLLADDTTGYNTTLEQPPRRTAIITASRLSRRLLQTMHKETSMFRHTMFSEMWPATMALHHAFKAVYAPHPVYVDRAWPPAYLAETFNNGFNGASGGARTSVFNGDLEHNFLGVSWYYRTVFPENIWRRWLGEKVNNDGGEEWELHGEGRMCLPPMLLHPIRDFDFVVEEPATIPPAEGT